jgi:RNA polymerase sigma factor (sigma-70 family)
MDVVSPHGRGIPDAGAALAQHTAMLRRYVYVLGVRADRVEDLVQDAMVVALQQFEGSVTPDRCGAFLRGIARNLALRARSDAAGRREIELGDRVWHEQVGAETEARVVALRDCVRALPAASRRLLDRRYRDGADRATLARELGLRAEGVKSALRRLREGLKRCVEVRLGGRRTER